MMRRVALGKAALAAGLARRFRAGVEHTVDGAAFAPDAFTGPEWAAIEADPMLVVTDAPDGAPPAASDAGLKARIIAAVANLSADEFLQSGAPDLGALRAALPDDAKAITGKLRDAVWDEMKAMADAAPAQPDGGAGSAADESSAQA